MIEAVFADAAYYVALVNERDDLDQVAVRFAEQNRQCRFTTTDAVFVEVLAYFPKRGRYLRELAAGMIHVAIANPRVTLIRQDAGCFWLAWTSMRRGWTRGIA